MGSLQDQLLKAGLINEDKLAKAEQQKKERRQQRQQTKHSGAGSAAGKKKAWKKTGKKAGKKFTSKQHKSDSDLAAAYRAKANAEKRDKEFQKQKKVAEQEARRLRNLQLDKTVEDKVLNDEKAELPRYFNYMGKIRRVLVTEEQLKAINANELGIAVLRSRPVILDLETHAKYKELAPDLIPDMGGDEPSGEAWDDQYKGFEVPDDMRW